MDDNFNIRDQIIIIDKKSTLNLDYLSDIELSARFSKNKNNFEIFKTLLEINKKNNNLINNTLRTTIIDERTISFDTIKLLIAYGADVNHRDKSGSTILFDCCLCPINNIEIIKYLIESGANVNIENIYKYTPLMKLCKNSLNYDDLEKIKLLVSKGSKINCQDGYGQTSLMECFVKSRDYLLIFNIIKLLLDNKADIYIKNKKGKNIFDIVKDTIGVNSNIYSLIFNYMNLENDHLCESDINFIYNYSWYL